MLARLLFKTCHSPNQRIHPGMGRKKSTLRSAFLLGINIGMINQIKYSGLFPEKHASPVGTTLGLPQPRPAAPVVPVQMQPVKS